MTNFNDMVEAVNFFKFQYGDVESTESAFITFLCGHFHSYPKAMNDVLKEMMNAGLVSVKDGMVKVV